MPRMLVLSAISLLVAACGDIAVEGGEDGTTSTTASVATTEAVAPDTTAAESTATTASSQAAGGGEFCEEIVRDGQELDITNPAQMEEVLTAEFEHLSDLPADVPAEISDEWAEFIELTERLISLYAEHDFDLLTIPEEDLQEMQQLLGPSQQAILDHCGLTDFVDDEANEDETETTTPEGVPEAFYGPPGMLGSDRPGDGMMTIISSDAPFDEVVAHYEEIIGSGGDVLSDTEGERQVTWSDSGVPPAYIIWVQQNEGQVIVTISALDS